MDLAFCEVILKLREVRHQKVTTPHHVGQGRVTVNSVSMWYILPESQPCEFVYLFKPPDSWRIYFIVSFTADTNPSSFMGRGELDHSLPIHCKAVTPHLCPHQPPDSRDQRLSSLRKGSHSHLFFFPSYSFCPRLFSSSSHFATMPAYQCLDLWTA